MTMGNGRVAKMQPTVADADLWMAARQAMLCFVDLIERKLAVEPRTAELRKLAKSAERGRQRAA
ncbi:MAG: hypothetical protein GX557_13690 [Chloroflexi bacterium]|jgi:hypothetical protein|nr:hypothetical protein [Chloroflexota bacterium]